MGCPNVIAVMLDDEHRLMGSSEFIRAMMTYAITPRSRSTCAFMAEHGEHRRSACEACAKRTAVCALPNPATLFRARGRPGRNS